MDLISLSPETIVKDMTLTLVCKDGRVLLGLKKQGFGANKWNGFGGKVRSGESVLEAAQRELQEESGLRWITGEPAGLIVVFYEHSNELFFIHLFRATETSGEEQESSEMFPKWYRYDELPFEAMWPDDKHWLPPFLEGQHVQCFLHFSDYNTIVHHRLETYV